MNPEIRFGKPFLPKVGFEAETLASAVSEEGTTKRVSKLYQVDEDAVQAALDYYALLDTPVKPPPAKQHRSALPTSLPGHFHKPFR
mgnify:CR=1 FL=1